MKIKRLRHGKIIEAGDLVFCSQISIDQDRYEKMSKFQQLSFRETLERVAPDYHPVNPKMIGKTAPYQDSNPIVGPMEVYRKTLTPVKASRERGMKI